MINMRDIVELKEIDYNKLKHFSLEPCPDQVVGRLEYDKKQGFNFIGKIKTRSYESQFNRTNIDNNYIPNTHNLIVLVLESPHKDEYDKFKKSVGPAYGRTGGKINKYLADILNDALKAKNINIPSNSSKYDLVLVNAIQYQCSLGKRTSKYRDTMFLYLWNNKKCNKDYLNRLKAVLSKYTGDKIVINCCTKGKQDLKKLVTKETISNLTIKNFYICAHPSSWYVRRYRKIEKV